MENSEFAYDINGKRVIVGSRVKILDLARADFNHLTDAQFQEIKAFIGLTLEVYEVDSYGQAWVELEKEISPGHHSSSGVALAAHEMEHQ
ncbi:hypothetical protein [Pseudomonas paralcaligenes]|uniref:hypothetical protein n=1 Tax=Pseudomonas paralcaligenes TaxID=2772558 RepID=UPI001C8270ED|nr:hypothetical protein [Pseudomonas paralcaligenes]